MKTQRHVVNFSDPNDLEAVTLAKLGQSSKAIRYATDLTPCQISYRLTKAKLADGLPRGKGYITAYRDGTSDTAKTVMRTFLERIRHETTRTLPPKFVVASPKFVVVLPPHLQPRKKVSST